jgi:sugar lactone lactonase YvrE
MEHRIVRFPWLGDRVGAPATWCRFDDRFNPDGMAFDGELLYVTGSVGDRIAVVAADGRIEQHIDTGRGSDPTNLCFQGNMLWVTLGLPGQLVSYTI